MKDVLQFTFDVAHPENPKVEISFIIRIPYFAGDYYPDGAVLENYINFRGKNLEMENVQIRKN